MGRAESIGKIINDNQCLINDFKRSLNQCNNGNNDNLWKTHKANRISSDEAEAKAKFLVQYLHAPQCEKFFLKCIYHLSEADIQNALECAMRPYVKSPVKYFNYVCKKKLVILGL